MRPINTLLVATLALAVCPNVPEPAAGAPEHEEHEEHEALGRQPMGEVLRWQQRADAQGKIPSGALWQAYVRERQRRAVAPLATGPISWTLLGPGNIGGRLRSVVVHPTSPSTIWVGSVGGGVWKTTNGGSSWSMLADLPAVLAVSCLELHPSDPNTLFAGTGEECFFNNVEGSSNSAVMQGAGLFKSTDGGTSWAQVPSTNVPAWNAVGRLVIDKSNPLVMVAATISGLWRSTDGGNTWSQRTTTKALVVAIDPSDPSKYVAGRADGVAMYSTDGGVTWGSAPAFPNVTRVELAYAKSAPGTVYACTSVQGASLTVWRSTDGGKTWTLQTTGSGVSTYANYNNTIWVDPTNVNVVVIGGVYLYRSTNAGVSFSSIAGSVHADIHRLIEHPAYDGTSNRQVFVGCDGGIYRCTDILASTVSATSLNNGLAVTQFYGCCVNPTSGVALGGAQDNGTVRYTSASGLNGWTSPGGGDGSYCASDPSDPSYFYMQYQYLGLSRSSNAGQSSGASITSGLGESNPNFMSYILLDPNDSNRLYACGAALRRASNAKTGSPPTWTVVKPALGCPLSVPDRPDQAHFDNNPPCNISTVSVAKGNPNVVWVGHNNGHVYFTGNALAATPAWTKVDDGTPKLPDRWVSRIVIDPLDTRRVTVSFMGFAPDNVWRTTDSGATWSPLWGTGAAQLPAVPVSCLVQHRVIPTRFYAATDLGLWYTENDGAAWQPALGGPSIVSIDEIVWKNDRTLLVATHGRSMWSCDVDPAAVTPLGGACGATTAPGLVAAAPALGTTQGYTLAAARPNAPASLVLAAGPAMPTVLGSCVVQPALPGAVALSVGVTNASGGLGYGLPIPASPALVGAVVTAQMFVAVANGPLLYVGELSNGVQMTCGF